MQCKNEIRVMFGQSFGSWLANAHIVLLLRVSVDAMLLTTLQGAPLLTSLPRTRNLTSLTGMHGDVEMCSKVLHEHSCMYQGRC
jgi:hypothetical protein